ncbi:MAG: PQQ-like beta-propeller repeat protein [Planctomycetes bacterium]|nr:PQQ-like beta-propeller repeat protein [Planctomycetota bacterium]
MAFSSFHAWALAAGLSWLVGLFTFAVPATLSAAEAKASAPAGPASSADPLDWPMWRGPEQNGISRETGLTTDWDLDGKNILWQSHDLATRSTPIVMRGKLYVLTRSEPETPREGERVVCVDAATGKQLWENKWNIYLSDVPKERVAWSSVVGDPTTGRVFSQGVNGFIQCLDGETGKTIWSRSLNEEFGLLSTYGGRTNVPVVFDNLVIFNAVMTNWGDLALPAHRFLAFNKDTGETVWFSSTKPRPEDTTYSTPVLTAFNGRAAMVFGSGDGNVWALQPRTGKPLWNYKITLRGINIMPLVDDGIVYIGQSEENPDANTQGQILAIRGDFANDGSDITGKGALWSKKEIMIGRSSMLKVDDRLYGADDSGNVYTFNAKTGEQIGKRVKLAGSMMRASLLYADGKIFASTVNVWHVLKPSAKGVEIVRSLTQRFPIKSNGEAEEVNGSPIVSHGRLYIPTNERMICVGAAAGKSSSAPMRPQPTEAALTDRTPAQALLTPVESLIGPSQQVKYQVQLFNAEGQSLGAAPQATYTLAGPGNIDAEGRYTADSTPQHSGVIVTAKAGELTATARTRVIPPLPWKFEFSGKDVPVTWIGMRYRHQIRELEGRRVMVKITTIPKGAKSYGWFGPSDLRDYTIQADVRGALKFGKPGDAPTPGDAPAAATGAANSNAVGKMPDIGLINQRYTMDLMGIRQQLQIRSWSSELDRFSKTVPFAWQPNTWYTIKFRAEPQGSKAMLKGKVWPRGMPEPQAWSIEAVDEAGNERGSPGMYGNANDAEIYIDNVSVYPN